MVGSYLINTKQNGNNGLQNRNNNYLFRLTDIEMNKIFFGLWKIKGIRDYDDNISKELYLKLVSEGQQIMEIANPRLDDEERVYAKYQAVRFQQMWGYIKTELILEITIRYVVYKIRERRNILKRVKNLANNIKV
ncbi:hypothetical protein ABPG72_011683 [Tetrahymena utriculariae]